MMLNQWNDCFALQQDRYGRSMIRYGAQLPKQELYLGIPKGKQNFTTVLYFHGGGLTGDGIEMPPRLIDGECAVIAARYRVSDGSNTALDALDDAVTATAWVMAHIPEYGGDPRKIFIGGTSAGAWQAAMVGMNPALLAKHGFDNRSLAGIMCVSGQMGTHFTVKADLHRKEHPWAPVIDEYAPLKYVSADLPPVLLMTGDYGMELPTRAEENAYMAAALREVGHKDARHHVLGGHAHCDIHFSCDRLMQNFIARRVAEIDAEARK